jgi:hypothetical protein
MITATPTAAIRQAVSDVGDGVPAVASHMSGAHAELVGALRAVLQANEKAEAGDRTSALVVEAQQASS